MSDLTREEIEKIRQHLLTCNFSPQGVDELCDLALLGLDSQPAPDGAQKDRVVTITIPSGYKSTREFLDDCGFELAVEPRNPPDAPRDVEGDEAEPAFSNGITYAIGRMATLLGVTDWNIQEGSEDFGQDVDNTISKVIASRSAIREAALEEDAKICDLGEYGNEGYCAKRIRALKATS